MRSGEKMKKILVINTINYVIGGMSTVIMNYFENINPRKYQMDFIINENIAPKYLDLLDSKGAKYYYITRKKNPLKYFSELQKVIKDNHYDIVHIHGNSCTMAIDTMAAKLGGCRCVIAHSHNSTCKHIMVHKLLRPFFEFSCNKRLACSNAAGKWLFGKKSFTVIENALDIEKYRFDTKKRNKYRSKMNVRENKIVIGHVGLFNEQKNQAFIIELARHLIIDKKQNVHFMLVGEGRLMKETKKLCRQYGIKDNVTFCGTTNDIPGVMSAMDIFLFPSKWEGLGIVMIEAQLMGLPCVASSEVPMDTKISDSCKYLSLNDDITEWTEAVMSSGKKSLENKKHMLKLKNTERFDINVQIRKLESFYDLCR